MGEREWDAMEEQEFEAILEGSVSGQPPDAVVAEVTPWKRAMNRVLAGMALTTITVNACRLEYLLPAVGMVLLLLGFRCLRQENKWMRACFFFTVLRAAHLFPALLLNTTVLPSIGRLSPANTALTVAGMALLLVALFCLWRGLRAIQQKAGLPPRAGGALALMLWHGLICILAAVAYQGLAIAVGMVVGYLCILRSLHGLSGELAEAGYAVRTASVRVTDRGIVLALAAALVLGGACGYLLGGSYPMDWHGVEASEHSGVEAIEARLLSLGFPEYVLADLTPEDIAACDGALQVVVSVTDEAVNDGRTVVTESGGGEGRFIREETAYDVKELRLTGVGVRLPGTRERWILFHHFLWTVDPGFYGTESIQLWPVYQGISDGWAADGEATGRVLYDRDGKSFAAPYYSLGNETFTARSVFWGEQTSTDLFATFSMPAGGERHRGYVAYPVAEVRDGYIVSSWINYTHQKSWLQYPVMTAMEQRMTDGWRDAGAFRTVQYALQFYPTEEGVEALD